MEELGRSAFDVATAGSLSDTRASHQCFAGSLGLVIKCMAGTNSWRGFVDHGCRVSKSESVN
jgi:hypothetical protein